MNIHPFPSKHGLGRLCGIATGFVAFAALMTNATSATFTAVALSRQKAVVSNGQTLHFGSFGQPALNDNGNATFYTTVYGPGVSSNTNAAIISRIKGKFKLAAREGVPQAVNGLGTVVLQSMTTNPLINKKSLVFWSGTYETPQQGTFNTVYSFANPHGTSNGFCTVINTQVGSEPIADFNNKTNISLLALDPTSINDPLTVFRINPSAIIGIVSVGDTIIGLPLGTTYTNFGVPSIDEKNNVYFVANASGTAAAYDGIWYGKTGDPDPLVLINQLAPGANGLSARFTAFSDSPCASPRGALCAFAATAGGTTGIWVVNVKTGVITNVVINGSPVTNLTGSTLSQIQPPAINDAGLTAFLAHTSVAGTSVLGLFTAKDPDSVQKVVAVGDTVLVKGTNAKVTDIRFTQLGGLNKSGKVICTLSFDNRTSGVFIITP